MTHLIYQVLKQCSPAELAELDEKDVSKTLIDEKDAAASKMKRKLVLKNKI